MLKYIIVFLTLLFSSPLAAAQEDCFCLKCLLGQHRMVQAFGQSMAPEIEPDECRFARYLNGDYERLAYGDIIFFQHPVEDWQNLSRVVALGGDTVQMIDGLVWLNGVAFPQRQVADYEILYERTGQNAGLPMCQNQPQRGEICRTERFLETAPNGRVYEVLNVKDSRVDNTEAFNILEGFVFALGDHRDNAVDSRFPQTGPHRGFGLISVENIIGIIEDD